MTPPSSLPAEVPHPLDAEDCTTVNPSRKWYQAKIFSFGITPTGYVAVGVAPMGVVAIGIVPMGVISIGTVAMGVISAGFVSMGIAAFGDVSMSKLGGHKGGSGHAPAQMAPQSSPATAPDSPHHH